MDVSKENRNYKYMILARIVLCLSIMYSIVCLVAPKIMFTDYCLDTISDYAMQGAGTHSLLASIITDNTFSNFNIDNASTIKACDKELEHIYLNNTIESQSILKYKSCDLKFSADNKTESNHHYANLTINFDIQNMGWFFFPINFLTHDKTVSITRSVDLKEGIVAANTKKEITNVTNSLDYHNGDIVTVSANTIDSNNEYTLKGVITNIDNNSVNIDFEDASFNYNKLKFNVNSLIKIK